MGIDCRNHCAWNCFFVQSKKSGTDRLAADDFAKTMEKLPQSFSQGSGDWQGFLTNLDDFLKAHPQSSFTPSAYLFKAKAQFSLKKYEDALASYQLAAKKMKSPYSYLAQEGEAITQMQLEHWEQAKTIWTELAAKQDNPLRDFHLFNLALVQEQLNNHDQAMETYKKIVDEFPTSQYAETAKVKNPEAAKK